MTTGRDFAEIVRLLDSCQLTANEQVAAPARTTMNDHTIRLARLADLDRIKQIAVAAEMFTADEAESSRGWFTASSTAASKATNGLSSNQAMPRGRGRPFAPEPFAEPDVESSTSSPSTPTTKAAASAPR